MSVVSLSVVDLLVANYPLVDTKKSDKKKLQVSVKSFCSRSKTKKNIMMALYQNLFLYLMTSSILYNTKNDITVRNMDFS